MNKRLLYPDICKFIAIFLVTWSHCAQIVSGETWTNFLGGIQLDIAFNMPLFMILSGWFIDIDKMRCSSAISFVVAKFKRLIIPSFVWLVVRLILEQPSHGFILLNHTFWYLNALFICLCTIMIFAKLFKNNLLCCLFSIAFIMFLPYSHVSNVNFMFPFLWAGYGLRRIFSTKYMTPVVILCIIVGIVLSFMWSPEYTVYVSPFKSLYINKRMVFDCVYRFTIGLTLSTIIIYFIMQIENKISYLAHLGTYSLVIYTASLTVFHSIGKLLRYMHIRTNEYLILDLVSLCVCLIIICVTIKFSNCCKKNKILRMLFLGE